MQTRDFVYVGDIVAANMNSHGNGRDRSVSNVRHRGGDDDHELYSLMTPLAPAARAAVHGPAKVGEQKRSVLAPSLITPTVSLAAGLALTVPSFKH